AAGLLAEALLARRVEELGVLVERADHAADRLVEQLPRVRLEQVSALDLLLDVEETVALLIDLVRAGALACVGRVHDAQREHRDRERQTGGQHHGPPRWRAFFRHEHPHERLAKKRVMRPRPSSIAGSAAAYEKRRNPGWPKASPGTRATRACSSKSWHS